MTHDIKEADVADSSTGASAPTGEIAPTATPRNERRTTCPVERFGRPHRWVTGAFYWPLGSQDARLYVGEDYVMCGSCGQIEADADPSTPPETTEAEVCTCGTWDDRRSSHAPDCAALVLPPGKS